MEKMNTFELMSKVYTFADVFGFDRYSFKCKSDLLGDVRISFDLPGEYRSQTIQADEYTEVEVEHILSRIFN